LKLLKLQLENFRNYPSKLQDFTLDKNITIFIGKNGLGKTNLLEAIYLLSLGKSFRTSTHEDLIFWEKDYFRCTGIVLKEAEEVSLEVFHSIRPSYHKNFRKNEVNIRQSHFLGNLVTVLFHPEDLNMLYLSPSLRRQYLNIVLSQTDREYLFALSQYKKVLKQRNALLKSIREQKFAGQNTKNLIEDLNIWDHKIAEYGTTIINKRYTLINFLKENIETSYRSISDQEEKIEINYKTKIKRQNNEFTSLDQNFSKTQYTQSQQSIQNNSTKTAKLRITDSQTSITTTDYKQSLLEKREIEILQAKTLRGPHRDDIEFKINTKEIGKSASRGEFRTLLLAMKLSEIKYIKAVTGYNPILLLDDVFSELDIEREKKLLKSIKNCQVIITTTEMLEGLENSEDIRIIKIE